MALITIAPVIALEPVQESEARAWCRRLEAGDILYFPQTPISFRPDDVAFLLGQQQTGSTLHKNIAYKPNLDSVSGLDDASPTSAAQLQAIMRRYSQDVSRFLAGFLLPYQGRWQLDYASFRPQEEEGRDLPLRRRNDLLHTDAFPTRPTRGARILRFFHNIHPNRTRDWVLSEPFAKFVGRFAPAKISMPVPENAFKRTGRQFAQATGLGKLLPALKRTPYDKFMMQLHNAMKEDELFQQTCLKERFSFAPGSSWMVYTETVPHAVLAGQYALEQTLLVDPLACVLPESAPLAILEKRAGAPLA